LETPLQKKLDTPDQLESEGSAFRSYVLDNGKRMVRNTYTSCS